MRVLRCQALVAVEELTREHDLVVDLISEVRSVAAASDLPRMAQLARDRRRTADR